MVLGTSALAVGALVSLLLLNTVLAEDAFTLTRLQKSNKLLAQQKEALQEDIAREESPAILAQRAEALGMVRPTQVAYLDEPTGLGLCAVTDDEIDGDEILRGGTGLGFDLGLGHGVFLLIMSTHEKPGTTTPV